MKTLIFICTFLLGILFNYNTQAQLRDPLLLIPFSEFNGDTIQYLDQNFTVNCDNISGHDLYDLIAKLDVKMKSFAYVVNRENRVFIIRLQPYDIKTINSIENAGREVPYLSIAIIRLVPQYKYYEQFKKASGGIEPKTWAPLTPQIINLFKGSMMNQSVFENVKN